MLRFDIDGNTIEMVDSSGMAPSPRTYHASTLLGDFIVVIGGEEVLDLDDCYIHDILTSTWYRAEI